MGCHIGRRGRTLAAMFATVSRSRVELSPRAAAVFPALAALAPGLDS
jgi:hypothetical protein